MTIVPAGTPLILDPEVYPDAVVVAATLAGAGWPVVPLRHGSRTPLSAGGQGHEGARLRSAQEVLAASEQYGGEDGPGRWPGFGLIAGEAGLDGWRLVVVDVDGPKGQAALDELLGSVPGGRAWARSTYVVATPRGQHLYGVTRGAVPPSTTGKLAEGLDIFGASAGRFVVTAGSRHRDGLHYRDVTDAKLNGPAATMRAPDAPEVFARIAAGPPPEVLWSRPLPMPEGLIEALTPAGSEAAASDDGPAAAAGEAPVVALHVDRGEVDPHLTDALVDALAAAWPAKGQRHDASLALAGALLRHRTRTGAIGVHPYWRRHAADLIEQVARRTGDEEARQRRGDVRTTIERIERGQRATGWTRLAEIIGEDAVAQARDLARGIDRRLSIVAVEEPASAGAVPAPEPAPAIDQGTVSTAGPDPTIDVSDTAGAAEVVILDPSPWGTGYRLDQAPPEPPSRPELGRRSDGVALLAPGTTSIVHARKKAGKTFLALAWTADVAGSGRGVLWIDWEDGVADLHERLVSMGLDDEARSRVTVLRPGSARLGAVGDRHGPGNPNDHDAALDALLATERPALVVVNSLGRLLGRHGLNPNAADDTERVEPLLTETLTATGAAVAVIDHQGNVTTDRSAGSHRKGALVTGAELSVERVQRMGRGLRGWATLRLVDERNGHLARLTRGDGALARLLVDATASDGSLTVSLDPPEGTPAASLDGEEMTIDAGAVLGDDDDRREVLSALAGHPDGLTTTRLRKALGVPNGGEPLRRHAQAVAALVAAGDVLVSPGPRGSKVHRLAPDVEVPEAAPVPDRGGEDAEADAGTEVGP